MFSDPLSQRAGYIALQREMHDALRVQHPDWILPTGDSPVCDDYEARFAKLLAQSPSRLFKQPSHR